jgi:hypothetical protein
MHWARLNESNLTQHLLLASKEQRLKSVLLYMQKLNFGMRRWEHWHSCGAIALTTLFWQMLGVDFSIQ